MRDAKFKTDISPIVRTAGSHGSTLRAGRKMMFILTFASALALLCSTTTLRQSAAAGHRTVETHGGHLSATRAFPTTQISSGQLDTKCPSGCKVPITIERVTELGQNNGRQLLVSWRFGPVPDDIVVKNFGIDVEVKLEGGKVLKGSKVDSVDAAQPQQTMIKATAGLFDGDKRKTEIIKVTISAISQLKQQPLIRVTETSLVDGPGVDVLVKWDAPLSSCETAEEFEVDAKADPVGGFIMRGRDKVPIARRSAVVSIHGLTLKTRVFTGLGARVTIPGRPIHICRTSKTVT